MVVNHGTLRPVRTRRPASAVARVRAGCRTASRRPPSCRRGRRRCRMTSMSCRWSTAARRRRRRRSRRDGPPAGSAARPAPRVGEPGRRAGLDALIVKFAGGGGVAADAVERAVDGRGAAGCRGRAGRCCRRKRWSMPGARAAERGPRLNPGLVGHGRPAAAVDEHGHRRAGGEVGRAEDVQPQAPNGLLQDPGVERARCARTAW